MNKTVQYDTEADRTAAITENSSMYLIDDQILFADETHTTKNKFLIFSDTKPVEDQLKDQADNTLTIMEALADIYTAIPNTTA